MGLKITILESELPPVTLEKGEYVIGRLDPEAQSFPDIDLEPFDTAAKVSRKHAIVRVTQSGVTIEDCGSLNGTCINRKPRLAVNTKHALQNGDEVTIGCTFLKIEF